MKTVPKIVERTNGRTDERMDRRTDQLKDGLTDGPTDGRTNGRTNQRTDGGEGGFVNGFPSSILTVLFGQPIRALRFYNGPITAEIVQRDVVGIENLPLVMKSKISLVL